MRMVKIQFTTGAWEKVLFVTYVVNTSCHQHEQIGAPIWAIIWQQVICSWDLIPILRNTLMIHQFNIALNLYITKFVSMINLRLNIASVNNVVLDILFTFSSFHTFFLRQSVNFLAKSNIINVLHSSSLTSMCNKYSSIRSCFIWFLSWS